MLKTYLLQKDICDTIRTIPNLSFMARILDITGLGDYLRRMGPFTLFAPVDDAFEKAPHCVLKLFNHDHQAMLNIFKYHIIAKQKAFADDIIQTGELQTISGDKLTITPKYGRLLIDTAGVHQTDIECSNGIIHTIDSVMIPTRTSN
jgi:uncharacterized surface protein with fasciclin (FAS1) repeats